MRVLLFERTINEHEALIDRLLYAHDCTPDDLSRLLYQILSGLFQLLKRTVIPGSHLKVLLITSTI